jgi:hypothetical protein
VIHPSILSARGLAALRENGGRVGAETVGGIGLWPMLALVSAGASAYHGYHRNHGSVPWLLGWGALGAIFPVITPGVALIEGFGKPL